MVCPAAPRHRYDLDHAALIATTAIKTAQLVITTPPGLANDIDSFEQPVR
jgi:hypothetical protein